MYDEMLLRWSLYLTVMVFILAVMIEIVRKWGHPK